MNEDNLNVVDQEVFEIEILSEKEPDIMQEKRFG